MVNKELIKKFTDKYCPKCEKEECDIGIKDFGTYVKCIDKNIILEGEKDVSSKKRNGFNIKGR